jgi:hypothetical protein
MHFHLYDFAEMLALITSILCIKWLYKTPYVFYVPYLLMTVCAEYAGKYFGERALYGANNLVFNITTVIEFIFFYYLYFEAIKKQVFKNIIIVLAGLYFICSLINIIFVQGLYDFNTYTMLLGTAVIILFVFFYFYDAFDNQEPINLIKEPMFWISIGIFLFYLGDFTFNLMYPYLQKNNLHREQHLFHLINNNLIIFEYLCFSVALIICSRNRLTSKQPSSL